jgi:hypothetical protein
MGWMCTGRTLQLNNKLVTYISLQTFFFTISLLRIIRRQENPRLSCVRRQFPDLSQLFFASIYNRASMYNSLRLFSPNVLIFSIVCCCSTRWTSRSRNPFAQMVGFETAHNSAYVYYNRRNNSLAWKTSCGIRSEARFHCHCVRVIPDPTSVIYHGLLPLLQVHRNLVTSTMSGVGCEDRFSLLNLWQSYVWMTRR